MKWQMEHVYEKNQKFVDLREDDELTDQNGYLLRRFIEAKWDKVIACYHEQQLAAEKYYRNILDGCRKVTAIDIGWAASYNERYLKMIEKRFAFEITVN